MSCTFDAACLTSAVSGAQPSFAFSSNDANYFGISAQFTNSAGAKPARTTTLYATTTVNQGTDYVNNTITITQTQAHTVDQTSTITQDTTTTLLANSTRTQTVYHNMTLKCTASSPSTVTIVSTSTRPGSTYTVGSNTTSTATSVVTTTSTLLQSLSSSTTTITSTAMVPTTSSTMVPVTCTSTSVSSFVTPSLSTTTSSTTMTMVVNTSSSASIPSSSSSSSTSTIPSTVIVCSGSSTITVTTTATSGQSSSDPVASPTGKVLTCPCANGQTYNGFSIECGSDRVGGDFAVGYTDTYNGCINLCANTSGCVGVSYLQGSPGPCYMKNSIRPVVANSDVWGARAVNASTASATTSAATTSAACTSAATTSAACTSAATTSAATTSATTNAPTATATSKVVTCPGNDGQRYTAPSGDIYLVECYNDREDHDITSGSPVMVSGGDLGACMDACDSNSKCVDVTLSGAACYLKNNIGASQTDRKTAYGARLVSSKSKSIPDASHRRLRSRKSRVKGDPRVHPREIMGAAHPRMVLNAKDANACPGGCSGWGGPASTFVGTATVTVTRTDTTTVRPTVYQTYTATASNGTTITNYATATATATRQTVTNTYTLTATQFNNRTNTVTAYVTSVYTAYQTSYATNGDTALHHDKHAHPDLHHVRGQQHHSHHVHGARQFDDDDYHVPHYRRDYFHLYGPGQLDDYAGGDDRFAVVWASLILRILGDHVLCEGFR
ncbi:hypothetical protein FKW77_008155 [Venturia effusa]|uniref:Apple domain-containing protein n=1 Tax=Venturia effusa TaxID=50376 RepID=A0A517LHN3_9PEZI|nr:hypothetical protein FKW77_008155 [Venturia effusa]